MIYVYNGKEYNVNVIIKKIKNTYLRVDEDLNINVTTNRYVRKSDILSLINNNKDKINSMIENNIEKKNDFRVSYLGEKYDIIYIDNYFYIDNLNKKIYISNHETLNKFFLGQARKIFSERLDCCYNMMKCENICFPKMKIRKMKTRWGVCNASRETITLNYYLIERKMEELDYVIIHELSHFVHFNHSANFWNLVGKYVPNYKEIRKNMR